MNEDAYMTLATIAGEIWGTQARAHMSVAHPPIEPGGPAGRKILGYDIYFEIFGKLKDDFKKEVKPDGGDETETPDGEDT